MSSCPDTDIDPKHLTRQNSSEIQHRIQMRSFLFNCGEYLNLRPPSRLKKTVSMWRRSTSNIGRGFPLNVTPSNKISITLAIYIRVN